MGSGEAIGRHDAGPGGVEEEVDRHGEEDGEKDRPGEKVPAVGHVVRLGLGLGLSRWQEGTGEKNGTDGT